MYFKKLKFLYSFTLITAGIEAILAYIAANAAGLYKYQNVTIAFMDIFIYLAIFSLPALLTGFYFVMLIKANNSRGYIASRTCAAGTIIAFLCIIAASALYYMQQPPIIGLIPSITSKLGETLFAALISGLFTFLAAHITLAIFKYRKS